MTDNNPKFDIFGDPTKDDIKVGYISTDRGFVSAVTICEANDYAKLNPGTLFIFRNRKEIKYIDINQVNELTTNDLTRSFEEEECSGIQIDKELSQCNPQINLFGGGGLGVLANPVVGRDGSILAVDVVEGGFGYKYPPSAKVKDPCGIGAGAELKVTLVDGDEIDEVIDYTDEEDFEDYKICDDPLDKAGFGRRYSLTGKDIGEWNPNLYLNDGTLPFNEELKKYIDFLSKVPKPWWTTRTEPPLKTTSDGKISRAKYDVYHWAWGGVPKKNDPIDNLYIKLFGRQGEPSGLKYWKDIQSSGKNLGQIESDMKTLPEWKQVCEGKCKPVMPERTYLGGQYYEVDLTNFMNSYAISPVPMSNVVPSDFGGKEHYFEWEIFFPHDGEYVFKFQCDNKGSLYIDGEKQGEYKIGKGGAAGSVLSPPEESKVSMTTGLHRIRIDVFNGQARKKVNKQGEGALGDLATSDEVKFNIQLATMYGASAAIEGLDINYEKSYGIGKDVFDSITKKVEYGKVYDVKITSNNKRTGNLPATNKALVIDGKGSRQGHWRIPNPQNPKRIEFDDDARPDGSGFDVNATFTIDKGNGTWAADGKSIIGTGEQTITLWWNDRRKSGRAINTIKIGSTTWERRGSSGSVTHTFTLGGGVGVMGGENNKAHLRTKGQKVLQMEDIPGTEEGGGGAGNFYDDVVISVDQGRFYDINGLTAKYTIGDRPATSTGKSTEQEGNITTIFNSTDYIDKANRKLWRSNPVIAKDSGFTNKYGITPFDPTQFYESSMAGTHTIKWHDVNFPVSGEYEIGIGVDDNVRLIIGNEVNIYKEGFVPGTSISTGTSSYRRFITAGSYTIIAELDQSEGGKLGYGNVAGGGTQTTTTTEFDYRAIYYKESVYNAMLKLGRTNAEDYLKKVDAQIAEAKELANKNTERYTYVPRGDQGVWGLNEDDRPQKGIKPRSSWTLANLADRYDWHKKRWEVQADNGRWYPTTWEDMDHDPGDEGWVGIPAPPPPARPPVITTSSPVGINPMVLAINIDTAYVEEDVVDAKSWNQNPMGVALAIEAPDPPVPQEPEPVQEGRCPPNPFWSTRFKAEDEQWYPFPDSRKAYRYGMSPVKPYGDTTSGGGQTYSNTWKIDAPYSGFYKLKAAADDSAVIRLDGNEVLKTEGLSVDTTQLVGIDSGPHEITVEVTNVAQETFDSVNKRIFTTQGWASLGTNVEEALNTNDVEFSMWTNSLYGATLEVPDLDISYEKKYGEADTQIRNEHISRKVEFGRVYDVKITSNNKRVTTLPSTNKELIIDGKGNKPGHSRLSSSKRIEYDDDARADGSGFDVNATFTIDNGNATFAADGKSIIGTGEQTITLWWHDRGRSGRAINTIKIGSTTWQRRGSHGSVTHTTVLGGGEGVVGGENNKAVLRTKGENVLQMEDIPGLGEEITYDDIIFTASQGRFFDIQGLNAKFVVDKQTKTVKQGGTGSGTVKDGVIYSGPELFHMTHKAWGPFMNKASLLMNPTQPSQGTVNYIFSNVDFPESGEYQVKFQNDAHGSLYLDGKEIVKGDFDVLEGVSARDKANFTGQGRFKNVLIEKGKHTLTVAPTGRLGLTDVPASTLFKIEEGYDFQKDAAGFAVEIRKKMQVVRTDAAGKPVAKSWKENPVFVSAHLIPPPCPRRVRGKGAVKKITPIDQGNGYSPPPTTGRDPGYDVALELTNVIIEDGGINYDPKDKVVIIGGPGDPPIPPFNPTLGPFGVIIDIPVPPTIGFTERPDISIMTSTGIGFIGIPEFTPRRTPPLVDPDRLIQVTDLVGIKQTGYYDGKPYYGAVFYKDGTRYAGWYETAGQLVQIYDTLQESIDAMVTTPPSAIQRQGSDIRSNDPRLDIPGTPDNLTY